MVPNVETGGWLVIGIGWLAIFLATLSLASTALRVRIRIRRRPRRPGMVLGRGLSVLGFALALSGSPAFAQGRPPVPPGRVSPDVPTPPWTVTRGLPPPRPPVPFEATTPPSDAEREEGEEVAGVERADGESGGFETGSSADDGHDMTAVVTKPASPEIDASSEGAGSPIHPAIHGRRRGEPISPLFPRAGSRVPPPPFDERLARMEAMDRHPAGKGLESRAGAGHHRGPAAAPPSDPPDARNDRVGRRPQGETYTVAPGDSLWSIAADVLETDDLVRIARYWPRIHRSNPHIADPDLIRPGEVLRLPREATK